MRKTVLKIFAAGLAAASMTAFAAPTYAAAAQDTTSADQAGWCEVLPSFCCNNNYTARCRCKPGVMITADRRVVEVNGCAPIKED
ncbi:MAG: hypothetical protein K1X35_08000 [Caulobacteraceae bacterium]|nr:hypothetical protein [Caulobacteraceae bacterium]